MNTTLRTFFIALAAGGGLFIVLIVLMATVPGLDIGPQATILPLVLGAGVFASLNAMKGNRKGPTASGEIQAQALSFPPRPGEGYIVLIRRARSIRHIGFDMKLDGTDITQLMPGQFTIVPVPAGRHAVSASMASTPGMPAIAPQDVLVPEGPENKVIFFETRAVMSLTQTAVHLDLVSDTPSLRAGLERLSMALPVAETPSRRVG